MAVGVSAPAFRKAPANAGGASGERADVGPALSLFSCVLLLLVLWVSSSVSAVGAERPDALRWYVDDDEGSGRLWGDDPLLGWERMRPEPPEPDACSSDDLPSSSGALYAHAEPQTVTYVGYRFRAEVFLAGDGPHDVGVELRKGQVGEEGVLLASAERRLTPGSIDEPRLLRFDLGVIRYLTLRRESLFLKIYRLGGGDAGACRIFWDGRDCPTGLLAEPIWPEAKYISAQKLPGVQEGDACWGDIDGDGDLDLVYCGLELETQAPVTWVYRNQPGVLVRSQDLVGVSNTSSNQLAWGDYDGDGDLDLVCAGRSRDGPSTRLYRNDGSGALVADSTASMASMVDVAAASVAWGDYDLDGDLDLYVQGHDGTARRAILYENDPLGVLVATVDLVGLDSGSADWVDIDGDADLDLMVTGYDGSARRAIFYRNGPAGVLTDDGSHGLPGLDHSDAAWGDHDNDGDMDLYVTGRPAGDPGDRGFGRLYRNDGAGDLVPGQMVWETVHGSCAWGDYDNDADMDLVISGQNGPAAEMRIYANESGIFTKRVAFENIHRGAVTWTNVDGDGALDLFCVGASTSGGQADLLRRAGGVRNTPPSPPTITGCSAAPGGGMLLSWAPGPDPETPPEGLYYCLRLGTLTDTGDDVCSGTYATPLMGNMGQTTQIVIDAPPGTYAASLVAIDSGLMASPWSGWAFFVLSPPQPPGRIDSASDERRRQ